MCKYLIIIIFFFGFNLSAEIVEKVEIKGNERISVETIKVYGKIVLNNDYSSTDLNNILKNLYNTDFFEDIKLSLSDRTLNIVVKEYPVVNFISIDGEKSKTIKEKILGLLLLKEKTSFIQNKLSEDINTIKKIYASMGFNFTSVEAKIEKFDNWYMYIYY